jgi:hypothetical protein
MTTSADTGHNQTVGYRRPLGDSWLLKTSAIRFSAGHAVYFCWCAEVHLNDSRHPEKLRHNIYFSRQLSVSLSLSPWSLSQISYNWPLTVACLHSDILQLNVPHQNAIKQCIFNDVIYLRGLLCWLKWIFFSFCSFWFHFLRRNWLVYWNLDHQYSWLSESFIVKGMARVSR